MTQPVLANPVLNTMATNTAVAEPVTAPLTTAPTDPLQNLRDIQMPAQPDWWPPAPGWWILLGIIVLGVAIYGFLLWRKKRWQQNILNEVENTIRHYSDDRQQQLTGLSEILRRVALRAFPRRQVANLYGSRWLEFLDSHAAKRGSFMQADVRGLADETYRPPRGAKPLTTQDPLVNIVCNWIRRNLK